MKWGAPLHWLAVIAAILLAILAGVWLLALWLIRQFFPPND